MGPFVLRFNAITQFLTDSLESRAITLSLEVNPVADSPRNLKRISPFPHHIHQLAIFDQLPLLFGWIKHIQILCPTRVPLFVAIKVVVDFPDGPVEKIKFPP